MKFIQTLICAALICLLQTNSVYAKDASLVSCQSLKEHIEHYDNLRKKGGSAKQMEKWKVEREKYKKKYKRGNCKRWRKELI